MRAARSCQVYAVFKVRCAERRASAVERAWGVLGGRRDAPCMPGSVQTYPCRSSLLEAEALDVQGACYAALDWLRSAALHDPALMCTAAAA